MNKKLKKIIRSVLFERKDVERYYKLKLIVDSLVTQLFDNKEYVVNALLDGNNIETGYEDVGIVLITKMLGSPTKYGKYDGIGKILYFTLFPYINFKMGHENLPVDLATARVLDIIFLNESSFRKNLADSVAHELTHHLDFSEFGPGFKSDQEKNQKQYIDTTSNDSEEGKIAYVNDNAEYNAFFNQYLYTTINDFNFNSGTWSEFYKMFINNLGSKYFNYYTDKNKKKIQKRLYDTFVKLKEKTAIQ